MQTDALEAPGRSGVACMIGIFAVAEPAQVYVELVILPLI